MYPRQFWASLIISVLLLGFIIRLIKRGQLDISYCWVWLGVGVIAPLIVVKYDWLAWFSKLIGAVAPTTTLFLFAILVLFVMCLQFSIVISAQRRQIKKLTQSIALLTENK
ncbi:DUF2304 domain-containing protein [Candidatus Latescibacterota bacterium]